MSVQFTRQNIIGNITALFMGSAVSQAIIAISLLLTARQLETANYGVYAASFATLGLSSIVFNLGLDTWLLREGSYKHENAGVFIGTILIIKLGIGLVWFCGVVLLFNWVQLSAFPIEIIILSAIAIWVDGFFQSILTAFKVTLRNFQASLIMSSNAIILLLATLALIATNTISPMPYVTIRIGALLSQVILGLIIMRYLMPITVSIALIPQILRSIPSFGLSDLLAWTYMRADVTIIAFTLGEYYVGLYAPAVSLINAFFILPNSIYGVMVPVISRLLKTNFSQAIKAAQRTILLTTTVSVCLAIGLFFSAPLLIALLGDSYKASENILQLLALIFLFKGASFGMAAILVATGRQIQRAFIQAIIVVLNITLNLIAVYFIGVTGVAVVYVITEAVLMVGYSWQAWPYYSYPHALKTQPTPLNEATS